MNIINKILFAQLALVISLFPYYTYALTPTPSLVATFTSTVEAGTCNVQIQDDTGNPTSNIDFGDVYKSALTANTVMKNFNIAFSKCIGAHTANITTSITGSCTGANFPNSNGTSTNTEMEIWEGQPSEGAQFSCVNRSTTSHSLSFTSETGSMSMSARLVIAAGKAAGDVTAGNFSAPVTFLVTYQ